MAKKIVIIPGQRFGKLIVIGYSHSKTHIGKNNRKRAYDYYLCQCDCGNTKIVLRDRLISKIPPKSCGCISKEFLRSFNLSHGKSNTRLFRIWAHIKDRCFNENNDAYKNYGGRGISMCLEWKNDFMSFYNWAKENGYNNNLTIDRKDNNGNYEPKNCRWITVKEQHRNTRRNKFLIYNGEKHCISEWAEILGLRKDTILSRLKNGWSIERALEVAK